MEISEKSEIKIYGKNELAQAYNIDLKTLMRWIDSHCINKLYEIGYKRKQKIFLPSQIVIIFNHIGHPSHTFNPK